MNKVGFSITGTSVNNNSSSNLEILEEELTQFKLLEVDSIELPIYALDIIVGKKIFKPEIDKLKKIISTFDFNYTVHGELSVNLMDEEFFTDHKEVLKKNIEVSGELGASHLVTHFGYTTKKIFEDKNHYSELLEKQNECYEELSSLADSCNVTLAIECLFPFNMEAYAPLPSEIAHNLNQINHKRIKACLDFSHAYINCNYNNADYISEIKTMAPLSEHLHMHDSFGLLQKMPTFYKSEAVSYGLGDIHLPLGWGNIPFDEIFDELQFPKNTNFNFELLPKHYPYFEENIKIAKELINKISA